MSDLAAPTEQPLKLLDLEEVQECDLFHDGRRQVVFEERPIDDLQTGVGAAVRREPHRRRRAVVVLEVQQALWENEDVALVQRPDVDGVCRGADEARDHDSLDDEEELGGFRVGEQRHDAARGDVETRGGYAKPVHGGVLINGGGDQANHEGTDVRAGAGQAAVVEVIGDYGGLGLARVASRRVALEVCLDV